MSRRRSVYKLPKLKLKPKTIITVGTIIAFILSLFSIVSIVGASDRLLFWKQFLFESMGWTFIFSPILFALIGLVIQKLKWRIAQLNVFLGLFTAVISAEALTASLDPTYAGSIGIFIWKELAQLVTPLGGIVALILIFTIGLVVLFNTSLDQILGVFSAVFAGLARIGSIFARKPSFQVRDTDMKVTGMDDYVAPLPTRAKVRPQALMKDGAIITDTVVANVAGQGKIWKYPGLNMLSDKSGTAADRGDVKKNASIIEKTLDSFGIQARVAEVNGGPAVTQYALEIPAGTKITKIANLQNDIALSLATRTGTVRIEAPIPGKSLVGIEVPNHSLEVVTLKSVMGSDEMSKNKSKLTVALGKDTASKPVIMDIARMPHILIAGTTGSGKSVLMHSFITSLMFRNSPDELKMILIDPKRVEMSNYNDIPHLLAPVIVEPEKILSALKWATAEMDRRYKLFQSVGVRNIQSYNEMSGFQALPYIAIFIDELADLMMFAPVEVEDAITRIAQLARAVGIHLVIATQRPSVDVITGLMKANIPCRIAFNVSSMIDSRVILDGPGAEKLLGRGDMLFMPPDASKPMRIQGVFVTDTEVNFLVKYLKEMGIPPQYAQEVTEMPIGKVGKGGMNSGGADDQDDLFEEAVRTVCQYDRASASLLQRRLRVGYARAARILDELESAGVVGPGDGAKPRDVLVRNPDEYFAASSGGETPSEQF
ncbi:hypothetical protein A2631_04520 [Candidatus Daviesbacteria bacterium RIFCSPHIGHO2_01_FULL_44_29]|uniref:FtsK domain-containing protein n=1 Tax=Candidatus Daviesbacteria bacterium RIFCSPHIGHO2_02_FULL_43_12 TaxID=1797776 RepID=A0A1F5KGD8_9BACT|nr:MAG: hypothetical protein A2631_04520 [Candidatus Daviesbacteria bacterium RIFCSPHIGHO2_01_FULL_44_29]OGE39987.1 MAG: hypothetical protein A3D25_04250 [Candidatus Daviesbacteria bacterium RIFCSPHIGHO2_02_FULL_43_12]OGE70332.1 MAG: hypothetical protein A3B55_01320 [Candidatus Daviesbacteria bacterium RIFCSPLOWO2_01_FULL_43_15]